MRNWILFVGIVLTWHVGQAKTVLISDIDDTLKNAHILDKSDSLRNAYDVSNLVLGMGWAYQALADSDTSIKFYYLSNAPKFLMAKSHQKFLTTHAFPSGFLLLRGSLFEKEHKIKSIRKIIELEQPDTMILVGDNGERDVPIYDQARKEFPHIQFITYIRMAYFTGSIEEPGVSLLEQQKGFATAFEVFSDWNKLGLIESKHLRSFVYAFKLALDSEPGTEKGGLPLAFPNWMDCRDHSIDDSVSENFPAKLHRDAQLTQLKIENRCSAPGSEN